MSRPDCQDIGGSWYTVVPFGEAACLVQLAPQGRGVPSAASVARLIAGAAWPGLHDVVPAATTVLVRHDPFAWAAVDLAEHLAALLDAAGAAALPGGVPPVAHRPERTTVELAVRYDGQDLDQVARMCRMQVPEVVSRHVQASYVVAHLGFSPGFAYLDGLDPALEVPRLERPRSRVAAGSVGIAGSQTCIYPSSTPGGWRLLGHTEALLFDPRRQPPALLQAGDRVRFVVSDAPG